MKLNELGINKTWTLFLDRDGVINHDTPGDYVRSVNQLKLFETTLPAMKVFAEWFELILIVTNQRGVGLGLMSLDDLHEIHHQLLTQIAEAGGRIDKIYFCTDTDKLHSTHRKPAIGMGLDAQLDFPEIDFAKAIMVGNNDSDIQFGKTLGMITVFIDDRNELKGEAHSFANFTFNNLAAMADKLID